MFRENTQRQRRHTHYKIIQHKCTTLHFYHAVPNHINAVRKPNIHNFAYNKFMILKVKIFRPLTVSKHLRHIYNITFKRTHSTTYIFRLGCQRFISMDFRE